jgi:hypothetical protein
MAPIALPTRKEALIAKAAEERAAIGDACRHARMIVRPPVDLERAQRVRGFTAGAVNLLLPLLGPTRLGQLVRYLSIGLTAYRAARRWR